MKPALFAALLLVVVGIAGCGNSKTPNVSSNSFIFVTDNASTMLFTMKSDPSSGALTEASRSGGATGQTWLAADPATVRVYLAANDVHVASSGNIAAFNINVKTGDLSPLGEACCFISSGGTNPVAVAAALGQPFLYVLNQGSNTIAGLVKGSFNPVPGSPFATEPNGQFLAVSSDFRFLFVANGTQGTISAFAIGGNGALSAVSGSPFAAGGNISWVAVDPKGRFLFATDTANNKVAAFTIQSATGALTPVTGSPFAAGVQPASLIVDSTGTFVYATNPGSNTVSGFRIDATTGALTAVAGSPFSAGNSPQFLAFDGLNRFVYVTHQSTPQITGFAWDANTGTLTTIPGSPFTLASPASSGATTIAAFQAPS